MRAVGRRSTDALAFFRRLLDRYSDHAKVGFGLKIADLPKHYRFSRDVRNWEGQFWAREVEPGVYDAPIDTTFALHRPDTDFGALMCCSRWPGVCARASHTSLVTRRGMSTVESQMLRSGTIVSTHAPM